MNNFEKSPLMAVRDFIDLGLDDSAYIKPVVVENEQQFAIYTADGEEAKAREQWDGHHPSAERPTPSPSVLPNMAEAPLHN